MRVAILWATMTGYINAAAKGLAATPDTEVFVADNVGPTKQAPFAESLFAWIPATHRFTHDGNPDAAELLRRLEAFRPDVLFVASWSTPAYNFVCKAFAGRAVRVCAMDNQWRGTAKQWLGVVTAPFYVRRLFDCIMVAGERQRLFAQKMGYDRDHILERFLTPDYAAFSTARLAPGAPRPRRFLCTVRLLPEKGIAELAQAYKSYRERMLAHGVEPWPLDIAGTGSMEATIAAVDGVSAHGFVQPDKIPALFRNAGCFVLPSLVEPWGVVLQEAAVAGLPVICTEECGASVHYVIDGYNGAVIATGSAAALTRAMQRISLADDAERARMSTAALAIGEQMTPKRWADYLLQRTAEMKAVT